jgi:hypothetical protein
MHIGISAMLIAHCRLNVGQCARFWRLPMQLHRKAMILWLLYALLYLPMFDSFRSIRIGTSVKIFMGAGWEKGTVMQTGSDRCQVQIAKRTTTIYDLRNIKRS